MTEPTAGLTLLAPGLCGCGCGGTTKLASQTNTSRGDVQGYPVRFLRGHSGGRHSTRSVVIRAPETRKPRHEEGWVSQRGKWARLPLVERFWAKVDKTPGLGPKGDCWEWRGAVNQDGYGQIWVNGKQVHAHRAGFEMTYGPLPPGEVARHRCNHPPCARPDHVVGGTQAQNIADREAAGHTARGERSGTAKLTEAQVRDIRESYRPYRVGRRVLGERYGVDKSTIDDILNSRTWKQEATA